jgi:hypothetical protein
MSGFDERDAKRNPSETKHTALSDAKFEAECLLRCGAIKVPQNVENF